MRRVKGGYNSYGQLAGILMLGSTTPRAPGDLGHALTFDFPVRYGFAPNFPFADLIDGKKENLHFVIEAVKDLKNQGSRFVAADCGLFSVFHQEVNAECGIPFLSSSLMMIPFLKGIYPGKKIGVLTGDTRILSEKHLQPVGARLEDIAMEGLENSSEFQRVVIEHEDNLDLSFLERDTLQAGQRLIEKHPGIGAIILECTNLNTFKQSLQQQLGLPVYDMMSLVNWAADGFLFRTYAERFI
ncbi:MAG: aspartate/glutamate racemase family protein [Bacillota bacterium]|nr:aspartate/glutamate racemase family protein [Bacillota bacterium]